MQQPQLKLLQLQMMIYSLLNQPQTLTNKTLTSPTITGEGNIEGSFTGNLTGNLTGNVTGNADTATTATAAEQFGGVSFDWKCKY